MIAFASKRLPSGRGGGGGTGETTNFAPGVGQGTQETAGAQNVPGSQNNAPSDQNASQQQGTQQNNQQGGIVNIGQINVTGNIDEDTVLKIKQGLENLDFTRVANAQDLLL